MTVAELRAILADAPDDAPVRANYVRSDGTAVTWVVIAGEYLTPEQWHDEAGVLLQVDYAA